MSACDPFKLADSLSRCAECSPIPPSPTVALVGVLQVAQHASLEGDTVRGIAFAMRAADQETLADSMTVLVNGSVIFRSTTQNKGSPLAFSHVPVTGRSIYTTRPTNPGYVIQTSQEVVQNVTSLSTGFVLGTEAVTLGDSLLMQVMPQARRDSLRLIVDGVAIRTFGEQGGVAYYQPAKTGYHDVRTIAWHHSASRTSLPKQFLVAP